MKKLAILIAALALTGCAAQALQKNEKVIILKHGTAMFDEALADAAVHCSQYGKVATMSAQTCPAGCVTQFRCE